MDPSPPSAPSSPPASPTTIIVPPTVHAGQHDHLSPAGLERDSNTDTMEVRPAATAKYSTLKATSAPFVSSAPGLAQSLGSLNLSGAETSRFDASLTSASVASSSGSGANTVQNKVQGVRPGTSSVYVSPAHALAQKWARIQANAKHSGLANSPFFPKNLAEFVEHQRLFAEDQAVEGKEKLGNMIADAEVGATKAKPLLDGVKKEVRDRILGDGRAALLGVPSIWTEAGSNPKTTAEIASISSIKDPKANLAAPVVRGGAATNTLKPTPTFPNPSQGTAAWPTAVEFKLHGEDRIKKYGTAAQRTLPVPVNSQWTLGEQGYQRKIWEYSDLDKVNLGSPVTGASGAGKTSTSMKNPGVKNSGGAGLSGGLNGSHATSSNAGLSGGGSSFKTGVNPYNTTWNHPAAGGMGDGFNAGNNPNIMGSSIVSSSDVGGNFNAGFNHNNMASKNSASTGMGGNFGQGSYPNAYSSNAPSTCMGNTFNNGIGTSFSSFNGYAPIPPPAPAPTSAPVVPINIANSFMPFGSGYNPFLTMTPNETPVLNVNEHGQYIFGYANAHTGQNMPPGAGAYGPGYGGQQNYGAGGMGAAQIYGGYANHPGQGYRGGQADGYRGMYPVGHGHPRDQPGYSGRRGRSEVAGVRTGGGGGMYPGAQSAQEPTTAAGVPIEPRAVSHGPFGAVEDNEEPPVGGWVFDEEWMREHGHNLEVLHASNKEN